MVRVSVSLFPLAGMIIGLVSMSAVWFTCIFCGPAGAEVPGFFENGIGVVAADFPAILDSDIDWGLMQAGAILFVLGLIVCLLTPLGGVAVILGARLYMEAAPDYLFMGSLHGWMFDARIGPFIALLCGVTTLLGLLVPVWIGNAGGGTGWMDRLRTIRIGYRGGDWSGPSGDARAVRMEKVRPTGVRGWLAVATSFALVLAAVSLVVFDSTQELSAEIAVRIVNDTDSYINLTVSMGYREWSRGMAPGVETTDMIPFESGLYEVTMTLIDPWYEVRSMSLLLLPCDSDSILATISGDSFSLE